MCEKGETERERDQETERVEIERERPRDRGRRQRERETKRQKEATERVTHLGSVLGYDRSHSMSFWFLLSNSYCICGLGQRERQEEAVSSDSPWVCLRV